MEMYKHRILILFLAWFMISPSMLHLINVSASGSLQTELVLDNDVIEDGGVYLINNQTEIEFSVTEVGTNFTRGDWWINGSYTDNGTYTNGHKIILNSTVGGSVTLRYRAIGSSVTESMNFKNFTFDVSPPTIQFSAGNQAGVTNGMNGLNSMGRISNNGTIIANCQDSISGVEEISLFDQNSSLLSTINQSNSIVINSSFTNSNHTDNFTISCQDRVGNIQNQSISIYHDNTLPTIQLIPSKNPTANQCLPSGWTMTTLASDVSTPSTLQYSLDNKTTWSLLPTVFTPASNFSGDLFIRAIDNVGNVNMTSINLPGFDQYAPLIFIQENSTQFNVTFHDDCGIIQNGMHRTVYPNGNTGNWIQILNGSSYLYPTVTNTTPYRTEIRITDADLKSTSNFTAWTAEPTTIHLNSTRIQQVGNYYGGDWMRWTMVPPTGGNFTYTIHHVSSNGTNTSIRNITTPLTSLTSYSRSNIASGMIYITITTTDQFNQTSTSFHSYLIDGDVTSKPTLSPRGNYISNGHIFGPGGSLLLGNLADPGGVGFGRVDCYHGNSTTPVSYTSAANLNLGGTSNQETSFTVKCQIVDLLGNTGEFKTFSGQVDLLGPNTMIAPSSGSTIIRDSTLTLSASDQRQNGTSIGRFTWSNSTSSWSANITFNGTWSGTLSQYNSTLGDGFVTAKIFGQDWAGNPTVSAQYSWTLSTNQSETTIHLNSTRIQQVGNYYGGDWMRWTMVPPTGGNFTYTIHHVSSNGTNTSIRNITTPLTSLTSYSRSNIASGMIYITITTTDQFNQTSTSFHSYLIDGDVTSKPTLSISGDLSLVMGISYVGSQSSIIISNVDESTGAGASHAECFNNTDQNSVVYYNNNSISFVGQVGTSINLTIKCRIVDLLGNVGQNESINFHIDLAPPVNRLSPASGSTITRMSNLSVSAIDGIMNGTSSLTIVWSNVTSNWSTTVPFNGSWNGQIGTLNSSLSDGRIVCTINGRDAFGNIAVSQQYTFNLNNTATIASVTADTNGGMKIYGGYIGSSASLIVSPPFMGTATYVLEHSIDGVLLNHSSPFNSSIYVNQSSLKSGILWLNVSSVDQYGRNGQFSSSYYVDADVTTIPLLSPQNKYILSPNGTILGPMSKIGLSNISDQGGVGVDFIECYQDGSSTPVSYQSNQLITPLGQPGNISAHSIKCRIVDYLENRGAFSWLNTTLDLQPPALSSAVIPGTEIILSTPISFTAADQTLNGPSELFIQWANSSASWNGTVNFNGTWNGSLASLNPSLTGGNLTVQVLGRDWLGNTATSNTYGYTLNSTFVHAITNLDLSQGMQSYGNYVGAHIDFVVQAPFNSSYSIVVMHSNGTLLFNLSNSQNLTTWFSVSQLASGTVSVIVNTTDAFGRTQSKLSQYFVDAEVYDKPNLSFNGATHYENGTVFIGPTGRITVTGFYDSGGVGADYIECRWNQNQTWITLQSDASLIPPSTTSTMNPFNLNCRIIDHLGNIGDLSYLNGSVDQVDPSLNMAPNANAIITMNTTIYAYCVDNLVNGTSQIDISWQNTSTNWTTTLQFNGSREFSLTNVNQSLEDGTIQAQIHCYDWLGNSVVSQTRSWQLNNTILPTVVTLDTTSGEKYWNGFVSNTISLSLSPPTGSSFTYTMSHSSGTPNYSINIPITNTTLLSESNLSNGEIWFNITTLDSFGRTHIGVHKYTVDINVASLPQFTMNSTTQLVNGTIFSEAIAEIFVTNLSDDVSGVGYKNTECRTNNGTITTLVGNQIILSNQQSIELSIQLECRIVDLLDNVGAWRSLSFVVDSKPPNVVNYLESGDILGSNSTIAFTCEDTVPSMRMKIVYTHQNLTTSRNGVLWLNGSQPMLNQLNLLPSGQLELQFFCKDMLGNVGSTNISGLYFTELGPYSEILFNGTNYHDGSNGISYVGANMTVYSNYIANGNGNVTLNLSVYRSNSIVYSHSSNSSIEFDLGNLSQGAYRLKFTTCSTVYCTVSNEFIEIDRTGPTRPGVMFANNLTLVQSNSTVNIGKQSVLSVISPGDASSGLARTVCYTNMNSVQWNFNQTMVFSPYLESLLSTNTTQELTCKGFDHVNNPSAAYTILMDGDFVDPVAFLSLNRSNGFLFPDSEVTILCTEEPTDTVTLIVEGSLQTTFTQNLTANRTYQINEIGGLNNQSQLVNLTVTCFDEHNNFHSIQMNNIDYRKDLGELNFIFRKILAVNGSQFVGNGSTIEFSHDLPIGITTITASINGSEVWEQNYSSTSRIELTHNEWNNIFQNTDWNTMISLRAVHSSNGTNISNQVIIGDFRKLQYTEFVSTSNIELSNGSSVHVAYTYSMCSFINSQITETYPNSASVIQVNQTSKTGINLAMPFGILDYQMFTISREDCVGNIGQDILNISRDIIEPTVTLEGVLNGMISSNRMLILSATDNSVISNLTLTIHNSTSQKLVCTSVCNFYLPTDLRFNHNESGLIVINISTQSGQQRTTSILFTVDIEVTPPSIGQQSENYSHPYVGVHSKLAITSDEPAAEICASVLGSSSSICVTNVTVMHWQVPQFSIRQNFTLRTNVTDLHGNYAETFYSFTYIPQGGSFTQTNYYLRQASYVELVHNSEVPVTITLDGIISGSSSNASFLIDITGRHYLNATLEDALGHVTFDSIFILYDTTAPTLNLSLSNSTYMGRNSSINVYAEDSISNITSLHIQIEENGRICSHVAYHSSSNVNQTVHLHTILAGNCVINSNDIFSFNISVVTFNEVGQNSTTTYSASYYGRHLAGMLIGTNYSESTQFTIYVSNHSELSCATNHLVPTQLFITANGGNYTTAGQMINWDSGSATLTCHFIDVLSNKWEQSWNVIFVLNDIQIDIDVLNNSEDITRFGKSNIGYSMTSSTDITGMLYYLNSNAGVQLMKQNDTIEILAPDGNYTIRIQAISILGYVSEQSIDFTLDSSPPTLEISNGTSWAIINQTKNIYIKGLTETINLLHYDTACGLNNSVASDDADIVSITTGGASIRIGNLTNQVSIIITDCVGIESKTTYNIVRISNIPIQNLTSILNSTINGGSVTSGVNSSYLMSVPGALSVEITCSTTTGQISCTDVGKNTWRMDLFGVQSDGVMEIDFLDQIGNSRILSLNISSDAIAPTCVHRGVKIGGTLHLKTLMNFVVECSDNYGQLQHISITNQGINQIEFEQNNISIHLSSGHLTIQSRDLFGNVYEQSYNVLVDVSPPTVHCRLDGVQMNTSEIHYVRTVSTISCEVNDLVSVQTNLSLTTSNFSNTTTLLVEKTSQNQTVILNVPLQPHGTTNEFVVRSIDALGNMYSSAYTLSFDTYYPEITPVVKNSDGNLIENHGLFASDGTYELWISDETDITSSADVTCESGNIYHYDFKNFIEILPSPGDRESCGSYASLVSIATDAAGNQMQYSIELIFDSEAPELILSSTCPISGNGISTVLRSCQIVMIANDDSNSVVKMTLYVNDQLIGVYNNSHAFDLENLPSNEIQRVSLILSDEVGRSLMSSFDLRIQGELFTNISRDSCAQTQLRCEPSLQLMYDYLLTGNADIDLELSAIEQGSVELVSFNATLCHQDYDLPCISYSQLPLSISTSGAGGYWAFDYTVVDNLGRTHSASATLLIEETEPGIIILEAHPRQVNEGMVLVCDTCYVMVRVDLDHSPMITSNTQIDSVIQTSINEWMIKLNLSESRIERSANSVELEVMSAGGKSVSTSIPIEYLEPFLIVPRISDVSTCTDNAPLLLDSQRNPSFLCLYDSNDLNEDGNQLELLLDIYLSHDAPIGLEIQNCFILGTSECENTSFVFNSTSETIPIKLKTKADSWGIWMEYEFRIYLDYMEEPIVQTIALVERDDFVANIMIDESESNITIIESGRVEFEMHLNLDVELAGHSDLDVSAYLELFKSELMKANCTMSGSQYSVINQQLGSFNLQETIGHSQENCITEVSIISKNQIVIYSVTDWSESQNRTLPGDEIGIFHLFVPNNFQIEYFAPIEDSPDNLFWRIDKFKVSSNQESRPKTEWNQSICDSIATIESGTLGQKIDGETLKNCLESFRDADGVYALGLELKMRTNQGDTTVQVLCRDELPPNFLDGWLNPEYYERDHCWQKNLNTIQRDNVYKSIELVLLICDLRCKIDADYSPDKEIIDSAQVVYFDERLTSNNQPLVKAEFSSSRATFVIVALASCSVIAVLFYIMSNEKARKLLSELLTSSKSSNSNDGE